MTEYTEYIDTVANSELMHGISKQELPALLSCLSAKVHRFSKGETIFREGDKATSIGIMLKGTVSIVRTDFDGNKNIVLSLTACDIFAESAVFSSDPSLPFAVESIDDSIVLMITKERLERPCGKECSYHIQLIRNMLTAIANRNTRLTKKITILTQRTTREKILELLSMESRRQKSKSIMLNMSRQDMADFLSTNRSALSRELAALQQDGIIDFYKNSFKLLK